MRVFKISEIQDVSFYGICIVTYNDKYYNFDTRLPVNESNWNVT